MALVFRLTFGRVGSSYSWLCGMGVQMDKDRTFPLQVELLLSHSPIFILLLSTYRSTLVATSL